MCVHYPNTVQFYRIIYTIVKNKYIPESFKDQMKKAAAFGRQSPLRCYAFRCDSKKDVFSSFK